ncbi:MAG: hypothetical protein M3X11_26440, partial [Acidobacteriota bacterium]|nr:hypothetical protein [Acidobacteriota bacterium]
MPFDNHQPAVFPSSKLYYIAASVLILYWLLLLFPQIAQGYGIGLDQSWIYALSYFPGSAFLFGRDVAFTFGPLGYLWSPAPIGAVFLKAALIKLAAYLLLAAIMFVYWRETKNKWALVAFLFFQILLQIFVFGESNTGFFDQHVIFQIGLLAGLALKGSRWGTVAMVLAALLAAISLYIKASNGVAAGAILGLAGVVLLISRREFWKTVLASWLVYVVAIVLLSLLLLGSLAHLLPWLKASYEMVRGYSSTMSLQGPRGNLVRALSAVAIYAGLGVWLIRRRSVAGGMAIALGGTVFVFFKAGIVRQDGHELFLFLYLPMLMSILILLSESAKVTAICLVCAVAATVLGLPSRQMHWNQFIAPYPVVKRLALLETTWGNITVLSHLEDVRQQLARQSQINLLADQLPEGWLKEINRNAQTVDAVPWEINYCPANDLRWNPTPTLQLYTAYTAWLDNWDAEHFIDRRTPD